MARQARIVVPHIPHHVTQRGNRGEAIFFEKGDEDIYLDLLSRETSRREVEVWAYCLMPNHVHLILTPQTTEGLGLAIGEAHRRYTNFVNVRGGWTGHLFQSRFASVAMDEDHLLAAVRYGALNPVRAGLASRAADWPWSSVRAHLAGIDDALVRVAPLLARTDRFEDLLKNQTDADVVAFRALRTAEKTGRPVGSKAFIDQVELRLGRVFGPRKRGRKPKTVEPAA